MSTVLVLYGPKAAGKTGARILEETLEIAYVNADEVIPRLLSEGHRPHPEEGWLRRIEIEVLNAVERSEVVGVEATGAWHSDWRLPDELAAKGIETRRLWIWAPLEECLARLRTRPFPASIPDEEARWIHRAATQQASSRSLDLVLDTSTALDATEVTRAVSALLHKN